MNVRRDGRYADWQATGMGLVVEERQVDHNTVEDKEEGTRFVMGAEG